MVAENKVPGTFSPEVCRSLLAGTSTPQDYLSRPSQILQNNDESDDMLDRIQASNANNQKFMELIAKYDLRADIP